MSISHIFNNLMNFMSKLLGGIPLECIGEIKEAFGDECALCIETPTNKSYIEIGDDTFIPVCRDCKKRHNSGMAWSLILKNNFINKNRRYSNKYLRIVAWIATSD